MHRGRRTLWLAIAALTLLVAAGGAFAVLLRKGPAIVEGPMVQLAGEDRVHLVWFGPSDLPLELVVSVDGTATRLPARPAGGGRYDVEVGGLEPGRSYPYRILSGDRELYANEFRTNRPSGQPFRFVAFGDSGSGSASQAALAARIEEHAPDFIVHTGDIVYDDGDREDYKRKFFDPYAALLSKIALWPTSGNHDQDPPGMGEAFREVFDLPANGPGTDGDYWFDYADARFVVVNTEHNWKVLRDEVSPWLVRTFETNPRTWRFVVQHIPPFASRPGGWASRRVARGLVPALEEARVDVAFTGHRHFYERTLPVREGESTAPGEGVVYVITGAGGGTLRPVAPAGERLPLSAAAHGGECSFTLVDVDGKDLHLRQIAQSGRVVDDWLRSK